MSDSLNLQGESASADNSAEIEQLVLWLESAESDVKTLTEEEKTNRRMNSAVFPITVKGFERAFCKVTRSYNPETDKTRLSVSTFAYNVRERLNMHKKSLSVAANGHYIYTHNESPANGVIIANWLVRNAMTPREMSVIESVIRKVNNVAFPLWGTNAASAYLESLRQTPVERTFSA